MKPGSLVVMEHRGGEVKNASLEALSLALKLKESLGGDVAAVLVGGNVKELAGSLSDRGPDQVLTVEAGHLDTYSTEGHSRAVLQALRITGSGLVLCPATVHGRDLAPAVAGALDCAYAAECLDLRHEDGRLTAVRPVYAGKAWASVSPVTETFVAGIRPNVFSVDLPQGAGPARVQHLEPEAGPEAARGRVTEVAEASKERKDVAEAEIIVTGGRGVGGPEGFAPLEELADALGAAVGASRAVVDLGWRPHSEQVGQTGKVVSPKLYIACGVSGAIQHQAGMRTSKVIVAINKDPEAPIFKIADYGIVGDLFEVVPALTRALRE